MDCKVVWTDPAIEDLRNIVSYIATENPDAAAKVGADIIQTVELLQSFPLIGPSYSGDRSGKVREIACWGYRIFYRVSVDRRLAEILTIWHGARSEPSFQG